MSGERPDMDPRCVEARERAWSIVYGNMLARTKGTPEHSKLRHPTNVSIFRALFDAGWTTRDAWAPGAPPDGEGNDPLGYLQDLVMQIRRGILDIDYISEPVEVPMQFDLESGKIHIGDPARTSIAITLYVQPGIEFPRDDAAEAWLRSAGRAEA